MDEVGIPCPIPPAQFSGQVSAPLAIAPMDRSSIATAQASQPAAYVSVAPGGFILDLKSAEAGEPDQVSYMPATISQQEQAWFDRASDIN